VGGMFFSTFLTLVIVPVVYALLARATQIKSRSDQESGELEEAVAVDTEPAHI
jgi:hypothetical protein